jgi:hypothetical protein
MRRRNEYIDKKGLHMGQGFLSEEKGKAKFSLEKAMKAQRGGRGIALPFL